MEYIDINGERVLIPADVVAQSREAVDAWVQAEAKRRSPSSASKAKE